MATLWPVQDRATAALMERFYRGYASGEEPAPALAEAQRADACVAGNVVSVLLGGIRSGGER